MWIPRDRNHMFIFFCSVNSQFFFFSFSNFKCLLKKCIYGLKQAPRAWYQKFSPVLVEFGLVQSQTDPCLFFRRQQGEILIVIIFVDDSLVLYNNTLTFQDLTQHLKQHFEIRVLPATRFIGIDIEQDKKNGRIFLHQHSYTVKLLDKFNMGNCNLKLTPSDPNCNGTSVFPDFFMIFFYSFTLASLLFSFLILAQ